MIAIPLQIVIFALLLLLISMGVFVIVVDRRRFRDPLLIQSGVEPHQLAHLFESAPFGLILFNPQLQVVYVNTYAARLLPIHSLSQLTPDTPWKTELAQDLLAAQSHDQNQPHQRISTISASQTISWWICPLPYMSLLFVTDLSPQRRLQKASQTFLSLLSHELRTPLTAVLAHLDIARNHQIDAATRANSLTIIHQEVNRLARLVQDMLQLGRLEVVETVEKRPLDLLIIMEEAIAEVILIAETKNISISLTAVTPLPQILGDGDKLKQAFLNVLDNSIKYGRFQDQIEVRLSSKEGGVHVIIEDTGPGIPSEHVPYVTERLYRVRKEIAGSGLGLAMAAEICRLHDTQLEIESPYNGTKTGVRVSFLLPAPTLIS